MKKSKIVTRLFLYVAAVCTLLFILYKSGFTLADLTPETVTRVAHHNTLLILLIMLAIMCLQNLFTFIPLILVITVNIALFGFWEGYLYSCACSVIGSTIIFLSIRYFFPNVFTSKKFKKYEEKIDRNGFLFVLSGRILPFMPTNFINIISGMSTIKVWHFISATTLGNMIYGFVLASASFGILSAARNRLMLWIIIVVVIIIVLFRLMKKQKQPKAL